MPLIPKPFPANKSSYELTHAGQAAEFVSKFLASQKHPQTQVKLMDTENSLSNKVQNGGSRGLSSESQEWSLLESAKISSRKYGKPTTNGTPLNSLITYPIATGTKSTKSSDTGSGNLLTKSVPVPLTTITSSDELNSPMISTIGLTPDPENSEIKSSAVSPEAEKLTTPVISGPEELEFENLIDTSQVFELKPQIADIEEQHKSAVSTITSILKERKILISLKANVSEELKQAIFTNAPASDSKEPVSIQTENGPSVEVKPLISIQAVTDTMTPVELKPTTCIPTETVPRAEIKPSISSPTGAVSSGEVKPSISIPTDTMPTVELKPLISIPTETVPLAELKPAISVPTETVPSIELKPSISIFTETAPSVDLKPTISTNSAASKDLDPEMAAHQKALKSAVSTITSIIKEQKPKPVIPTITSLKLDLEDMELKPTAPILTQTSAPASGALKRKILIVDLSPPPTKKQRRIPDREYPFKFWCMKCPFKTFTQTEFDAHALRHRYPKGTIGHLLCGLCAFQSSTLDEHDLHEESHYANWDDLTDDSDFDEDVKEALIKEYHELNLELSSKFKLENEN